MLLANRTVATYVSEYEASGKPLPFPYRVHDAPDEAKLGMFAAFAARYGHSFDLQTPEGIAKSFNEMLRMVKGKPEQHVLESLGIRTMAKAVYTTENIGHYGLGFENYCHFTSPIRRYPDVLVHRILQDVLDGKAKPIKGLETVCRHCSDGERSAMEAERAANKYKQVEYMQDHVGEDFDAVVSGVSTFGFWAETVEHKCEGLVGIQELSDLDQFEYLEGEYALRGRHTGISFRMGDKLKIRVLSASLEKRQLDYGLAEAPQTTRGKKPVKDPKRIDGARRGQPTEKGVEKKRRKGE
jgi:ribonuclease R